MKSQFPTTMLSQEVAKVLRVSDRSIRRWCAEGVLPSVRVGSVYRVPVVAVRALFDAASSPRNLRVGARHSPPLGSDGLSDRKKGKTMTRPNREQAAFERGFRAGVRTSQDLDDEDAVSDPEIEDEISEDLDYDDEIDE